MSTLEHHLIKLGEHNKALRPHIRAILAVTKPREAIRTFKEEIQKIENLYKPYPKEARIVLDGIKKIREHLRFVENDLYEYKSRSRQPTSRLALSKRGAEAVLAMEEILDDITYRAEAEVGDAMWAAYGDSDAPMDAASDGHILLEQLLKRSPLFHMMSHDGEGNYFWKRSR